MKPKHLQEIKTLLREGLQELEQELETLKPPVQVVYRGGPGHWQGRRYPKAATAEEERRQALEETTRMIDGLRAALTALEGGESIEQRLQRLEQAVQRKGGE